MAAPGLKAKAAFWPVDLRRPIPRFNRKIDTAIWHSLRKKEATMAGNSQKMDKIRSYRDFWPYYLAEHSKPETRVLHYFGTALALGLLAVALATTTWWLLAAVPVAGYLFAWIGHFAVEKNRPATFTYPFWSLFSDFRMFFVWLSGGLGRELQRLGISPKR